MAWVTGDLIVVSDQWRFTAPLPGELIRVTHICPGGYARGLICQAEFTPSPDLFEVRRLYFREQCELFAVKIPTAFQQRTIGVRSFYPLSPNDWIVSIEYWDG